MNPLKKTILISLSVLITALHGICQEMNYATNIKTEISGDKMLITFDLVPRDRILSFDITLLITYDGEKIQPNLLYGDYGTKIDAGSEKSIVWYYKDDFKKDINDVKVEVFAFRHHETTPSEIVPDITAPGVAKAEKKQPLFIRFIGIRGGLNLADLGKEGNKVDNENLKMNPGFQLGVTSEFQLSGTVMFETGLLFTVKGAKKHIIYEENDIEYKSKIILNYLEIPFTAKIYPVKGDTKVFCLFGPYLGFGLSGKENVEHTSGLVFGSIEADNLKTFDFGLTAGTGIDISPFQLGMFYSYGLANVFSNTGDNNKVNNRVLGIYAEFQFGLK